MTQSCLVRRSSLSIEQSAMTPRREACTTDSQLHQNSSGSLYKTITCGRCEYPTRTSFFISLMPLLKLQNRLFMPNAYGTSEPISHTKSQRPRFRHFPNQPPSHSEPSPLHDQPFILHSSFSMDWPSCVQWDHRTSVGTAITHLPIRTRYFNRK